MSSAAASSSAIARSTGVRGAVYSPARLSRLRSGAGSALRSVLPFAVRGSVSSTIQSPGTMASGSRSRSQVRISSVSGAVVTSVAVTGPGRPVR